MPSLKQQLLAGVSASGGYTYKPPPVRKGIALVKDRHGRILEEVNIKPDGTVLVSQHYAKRYATIEYLYEKG